MYAQIRKPGKSITRVTSTAAAADPPVPPWIGMPDNRKGHGRREVKLRDLKVMLLGGIGKVSLSESLYYTALKTNNRAAYDKYIHANNRASDTWAKFQQTLSSIRRKGFQILDPHIYITADNEVFDGHHRLAIAMLLYGSDSKLHISGSRVVGFITSHGL